ncbi:PAS domain S-box protein [Mucilaginibacter antarcticus]|uniref:PAS domain S-box protein n=1 Tax=Mucilaginibacter antarcticus TaxID=1855725 RepID=UPI003634C89D
MLLKHEDPEKIKWALEYRNHFPTDLSSDTGTARVLKTGEPSFVPIVSEAIITNSISDPVQLKALQQINIKSAITVPLGGHDKISGVVTFVSAEADRYFDEADLVFARNFAIHIGLALENASLNEAAREELERKKESEAQFRFLTNAIPHKLWTSGPDGRATYYNQGWYDYTGITDFETLREQIWHILHPDDRGVAAVQWPLALQRGEGMEVEGRFRRHDGMYRWHLSRFAAHKNEFGEIVLWVGTSTDIHEQKIAGLESAEASQELAATNEELAATNEELAAVNEEQTVTNEELTETQDQLRATIEELETAYEQVRLSKQAAQLGTFDLDLLRGTMEWDERCRSLFGINHQSVVTYENDFVPGLHPDDRDRVLKVIANAMVKAISNGDYDIEYRTVGVADEQIRWVRAKGKVYFNEEESPVRFIGSVLDVTEQKLNETRLKESAERQARLAAIVSTSDDTIVSKTLQGIVTSWNAAAQRMFGYTEEEILGKHISLIIPPERLKEEEVIISEISNGGRIDHFETVRVAKDGSEVHVSLSVSPVKDKGNIIGASKIARDISKQKDFEEKLQRYTRNVEILNTVGKLVAESLDIESILQRVTDATTQITGAAFGAFFYNQLDERGESYMLYTLSGAPREAFEKFGTPRNTAIFHPTFSGEEIVRSADITKDPRYGHNHPHHGMPESHLPVVSYLAIPVISKSGDVIGGFFTDTPRQTNLRKNMKNWWLVLPAKLV